MSEIQVVSKTQVEVERKPRVYFTCHPDDFETYFKQVCDDIFKTHDCAVYYTTDMTAPFAEDEKEVDLGRNNLFVVPVTYKLLSKPNRAMDEDIPYALKQHIPVLPIMMEQGLDEMYAKPEKFGELQYLNPFSHDTTEIAYKEKLKKYLEAVLISDEMAQRVRAAFDAYIFLSYRKKDRKYANELMRCIHSHPECRDLAIWFDEFLTPGESFRDSIEKILCDSQLFALLVTPNLLEEPNFVMAEEYPRAKASGVAILPAEMVDTDKVALSQKFADIPTCVNPKEEAFRASLLENLAKLATEENDTPEHNFLIGLAYLEGIDVEVDRERALKLILSAAKADLPEAMQKLVSMYTDGIGVPLNYRKAATWQEAYVRYLTAQYGEYHIDTLENMNGLTLLYIRMGEYTKALTLQKKLYAKECEVLGEEHHHTLVGLNNIANSYLYLGEYQNALVYQEKAYHLVRKVLGDEHLDTITCLNNLAAVYYDVGDFKRALEMYEKVYAARSRLLGPDHVDTLTGLNGMAMVYSGLKEHKKALECLQQVCEVLREKLGETHPDVLSFMSNLAQEYVYLGEYRTALDCVQQVYAVRCEVLGDMHPSTLITLNDMSVIYAYLGEYQKSFECQHKAYDLQCEVLGEEHPDTLNCLNNLACSYYDFGDKKTALMLLRQAYARCCRALGKGHPTTVKIRKNLSKLQ